MNLILFELKFHFTALALSTALSVALPLPLTLTLFFLRTISHLHSCALFRSESLAYSLPLLMLGKPLNCVPIKAKQLMQRPHNKSIGHNQMHHTDTHAGSASLSLSLSLFFSLSLHEACPLSRCSLCLSTCCQVNFFRS